MRKIGPFSADIVVSTLIHHLQLKRKKATFSRLLTEFNGALSRSGLHNSLNALSDWGVISTSFGKTEAGRAGRIYTISGESSALVRETYNIYWDRMQRTMHENKTRR